MVFFNKFKICARFTKKAQYVVFCFFCLTLYIDCAKFETSKLLKVIFKIFDEYNKTTY